jgi:hypothetical protein
LSALLIGTVVAWDGIVVVPRGSVWPKQFFVWYNLVVVTSCDQQHWLPRSAALLTLLAAMRHKKSLTDAFIAMVAADRPTSSQALWRFIAMVRDHYSA